MKLRSYTLGKNFYLNNKYIQIKKQNRKLKAKFLGFFKVLHYVGKQDYKSDLLKK